MPGLLLTNTLAAYGTLFLLFASAATLVALSAPSLVPRWKERLNARYGLWFGTIFVAFGTLVTLYYSEVLGQAPCSLCWIQRVFLYPQVVILGIGALIADRRAVLYATVLSLLGAGVALYHHALQVGLLPHLPCPADAGALDCALPTFMAWGFISFPFMAFALFLFVALYLTYLSTIWRKYPPEAHAQ